MSNLKEKIAGFPDSPGVYLMKDSAGKIIYIGKAKSLKKRVHSYFSRYLDTKNQVMIAKAADIEYRRAPSESQAQILEAALIKKIQPKYNIDLKDDKSFPWIRFSHEEFPVVSFYRRKKALENDLALYFGPYTNSLLLRQALKTIRGVFGFRSCRVMPKKACLYYRLKLCPAPCIGGISREGYAEIVEGIRLFLESSYEELLIALSGKMKKAAQKKDFETAARIRDQINSLGAIASDKDYPGAINELEELKNRLKLKVLPLRIEAIDISNISGKEATGSVVSFYKGAADKNNYRRFRIKAVRGIDDYAMLREVVGRRYRRLKEENFPMPDLVLIDGGKAHLSAAMGIIKGLGLDLAVISLAKDRENIYIQNRPLPLKLMEDTPALNLLRRVRDEAHRFALKYHRLLHKKKIIGR